MKNEDDEIMEGLRFQDIYQWASKLTAEQDAEIDYYWTEEDRRLLFRLLNSRGNLIAVIGLQGSGKTALRYALLDELKKYKLGKVVSLKWVNALPQLEEKLSKPRQRYQDALSLLSRLYQVYGDYKLFEILEKKFGEEKANHILGVVKRFPRTPNDLDEEEGVDEVILGCYPQIMKLSNLLGKKGKEFEKFQFYGLFEEASCILIDTPDYDKRNRREMIRDLNALQTFWEELTDYFLSGGEDPPNLVIFVQKELFGGHFFFGKMSVYEKRPLTPSQLTDYFMKKFPENPFTREAVLELAALSRGIFRRFKKYIQTCLENYYLANRRNTISVEDVRKWISLDMLLRDMELELLEIFPKRKEQRIMAVKLLRFLHEHGGMAEQKVITDELFEGEKMAASRLLGTLEAHGYVIRVKERGERGYLVCLPEMSRGGDI